MATGNLTLGGLLEVGSHTVTLLDSDQASLGANTTIFLGTLTLPMEYSSAVARPSLVNTQDTWLMEGGMNLNNSSVMPMVDGSAMRVREGFYSNSGQLNITGGGVSQFLAPLTLEDTAKLNIAAGSQLQLRNDTNINNATVTGIGALVNTPGQTLTVQDGSSIDGVWFSNASILKIGNSPGHVIVDRYLQPGSGELKIEIAGLIVGSGYDQLEVLNNASLDGTLTVELINNFMPGYGSAYTFVTASSITGDFENITGIFVDPDMTLAPDLSNVTYRLVTVLPGDADFNGIVNFADFVKLSNSFNEIGTT